MPVPESTFDLGITTDNTGPVECPWEASVSCVSCTIGFDDVSTPGSLLYRSQPMISYDVRDGSMVLATQDFSLDYETWQITIAVKPLYQPTNIMEANVVIDFLDECWTYSLSVPAVSSARISDILYNDINFEFSC